MKKCKFCSGKGFTMKGITYLSHGTGFGFKTKNIKLTCEKCFGKGVK
jgi:hypothetical protein